MTQNLLMMSGPIYILTTWMKPMKRHMGMEPITHGYGAKTLSNEAYGDIIVEERPDQDGIDDTAYAKYIGAEMMMDTTEEGPRQETVRRCVEELDRTKMGTYHGNPLMDTRDYELEYNDRTHDH